MAEMSMVERVIEANRPAWDEYPKEIDASNVEEVREIAARAAIEAMREPDAAMRLASKRYKRKAKVYSGPECYRQMIDAALSQGEG